MDDLDRDLRLVLFSHITRLCMEGGGLVSADQLSRGLVFHGQRIPIWSQRKGIFKPALLGREGAALSIQTAFDGPYDDGLDPDGDRFTYRYRGTDPDHADNRALRQALRSGRPLLYLVGVRPGAYEALFPFFVVADRRAELAFELMADVAGDLTRSMDRSPLENEALKAYATRTVRQRLHQQRFRYLVLTAYQERCAMCRLRHPPLLDAAHILPDRDERGKPEIPNGLSLCKIHHSAYDVGILGVDPDYRIHLRGDILEEVDGPMLRHGFQEIHGAALSVPRRAAQRPNRDYLAERFGRFRAA
jgi:putative restriction endonuclease